MTSTLILPFEGARVVIAGEHSLRDSVLQLFVQTDDDDYTATITRGEDGWSVDHPEGGIMPQPTAPEAARKFAHSRMSREELAHQPEAPAAPGFIVFGRQS